MTSPIRTTPPRPVVPDVAHPQLGLLLALVSAAAFGTSGTLAKPLLEAGWSSGAAVAARIGVAALVLLVPALLSLRGRWHLLRRHAGLILAYGLVPIAGCQWAYFNAVERLDVGVALMLEYLGLVLVVGWLWIRHGTRPRRLTGIGVVLALLGLALVLDVLGGVTIDLVGVAWGLLAAVGLAAYFLLSAREIDDLPPMVLATGGLAVGTVGILLAGLAGLLPMAATTDAVRFAGVTTPWWVAVAGLAVLAAAVAYAVGIAAARSLGSKVASFVGLTEVLFAVLFAWLLLGELPGVLQLVGGLFIVGGVVAVRLDGDPKPALVPDHP
ncbi:MAG: DMT family transporter [Nocardioides sp.]|nr:DMT family transporter [Nocardioides sp.]